MVVVRKLSNQKKVLEDELQKKENKLARASWKYHFFQLSEVEHYANYLSDDIKPDTPMTNRRITLTKLNYYIPSTLYTGK